MLGFTRGPNHLRSAWKVAVRLRDRATFGSMDIGAIAATTTYGMAAVGNGLPAGAGTGKTAAGSVVVIVTYGMKAAGAEP